MRRKQRICMGIATLWFVSGLWAWFATDSNGGLVGVRRSNTPVALAFDLSPQDTTEARAVLAKVPVWGVQRNGQPIEPPKPKEPNEAKIEWTVLGSALRKDGKFVLIQVKGEPPKLVKEGDDMPDGSALLKVRENSYTVKSPAGEQKTITTNF